MPPTLYTAIKRAALFAVALVMVGRLIVTPAEDSVSSQTLRNIAPPESKDQPEGTVEEVVRRKLAEGEKPNRLIREKSPYLLQHAFNPVDWYPWGPEAFEKAKRENKPIFLSIGYSTCYWCHVMEREVFENRAIAELMNSIVVSIKVDREERPDVDRVYMIALQGMTGHGGWPLSMFLTPDLKPFFGGTYFPPTRAHGRPGFPDLLNQVHEVWTKEPEKIAKTGQQIMDFLEGMSQPDVSAKHAGAAALDLGFEAFSKKFDKEHGGFGKAPKFPRPASFNFLLRYHRRTGESEALEMSLKSLRAMANGGIYDHIGGGFHRYATDDRWHVPHFEKMLYDQALLVVSYLEAYQITRDAFYADIARNILDYVKRKMTHADGGFYSAEDSESAIDVSRPDDKEEGAFYTWEKDQIDRILTLREAEVFNAFYGVKENGNVESDPQNEFINENILVVSKPVEETAKNLGISVVELKETLLRSRRKLFLAREERPSPHLDDKILVSWNGLMISGFARAYQVLGDREYLVAAERVGRFILDRMYNPEKKILLRRFRAGDARYEAHLEDHAFLIQALLDLYEASLDIDWLKTAIALEEQQIELFYDTVNSGFYDISGSDPSILVRTKESYDGAAPSGNSIAILNLLRLSHMIDSQNYRSMADKSLSFFGERILNTPESLVQFLVALDFSLSKPKQIIIAGPPDSPHTWDLLKEIHLRFIPNRIILLADGGDAQKTLGAYLPFIKTMRMIGGKSTAYICVDYTCKFPTTERTVVAQLLEQ